MKSLLDRLARPTVEKADLHRYRMPGRLAYIVNHSFPYSSNGYAVRTHGVAAALAEHGHSVLAVNRPGRPWNLPGFDGAQFPAHLDIDGVRYLYLKEPAGKGRPLADELAAAAQALKEVLRLFKPSAVMAASNWENALPAAVAARDLGLPFFYEVRGFWEISRASREPGWEHGAEFKQAVEMETAVARAADRVFTLNRFMREELARRGVGPGKIDLLPNAYGRLPDLSPPPRLSKAGLGCAAPLVAGYVGSFGAYEGLDDLVRAGAQLRAQGLDLALLMVGSGNSFGVSETAQSCPASQRLRRLADELGFGRHLHLTGRVAPDALADYYAMIDVVVIPRRPLAVCELVSPVKPLEAAAHGKPMLLSDVGPLKELAEESNAGLCYRAGDVANLAEQLGGLLGDARRRQEMGDAGRAWIVRERSWTAAVRALEQQLPARAGKHPGGGRDVPRQPARRLRLACVMDEFTYHSYAPECDLLQLTPEGALSELAGFNPDLLFIESAWRGKDELWNRKIGTPSRELKAAIAWCKSRNIPTVFWNKEDPIHFETFLTTAQQFDHVFTTDIDCIDRYKAALGHRRVYLLPFACQPAAHNPIETYERKDAFCFAGAYYVRYPERTRDLENYLAALPKFRPLEIFDRNFGKDDANYQFPPQYRPYIVGTLPFAEIDKAYKGYRYAINLNSIKQSQTMFARRVFELLASNTITASNFSRGVRLLFGDLVVTTDSGAEMVRRLESLAGDEEAAGKLRLAGLRKAMLEHTYGHRLAYVASKALRRPAANALPAMLVVAGAQTAEDYASLLASFQRQTHGGRRMVVALGPELTLNPPPRPDDERIALLDAGTAGGRTLQECLQAGEWLAPMVAADYYGPNYLLDLAIATRYGKAAAVGKAAHYRLSGQEIALARPEAAYRFADALPARCAAVLGERLPGQGLLEWLAALPDAVLDQQPALAIDPYNYCRQAASAPDPDALRRRVDDLALDSGIAIAELLAAAERIPPQEASKTHIRQWNGNRLSACFEPLHSANVSAETLMGNWQITSRLPDDRHEYLYARNELRPAELGAKGELKTYLDVSPGLNVQLAVVFLGEKKDKISHVIQTPNRNHTATIPPNTAFIRLGLRIHGGGTATVKALDWSHRRQEPHTLLGRGGHLVLTNHYPSYDDLYRNGFVHSRVKAYAERGVRVDVFRLRNGEPVSYHEFQNIDVTTGGPEALRKLLASGRYRSVLVHFLAPDMWEVLRHFSDSVKVFVWVHGAEIQPWHRRDYNYQNEAERQAAKAASEQRMAFWRGLLQPPPPNLHLVFVSRYFAEEVMEDLGFRLRPDCYSVIHNPIDTDLFACQPKPAEQRKKILSIRPYASAKYANDLSVKAILELAKKPFFGELEFRIIGDGKLFDELLEPLRKLENVHIERRFLTQGQIAELHRAYGIFLCPTRMDAQGVSRDEAMSSGLVPVTNAVAAIPEFVDDACGFAVPGEDWQAMAAAIARLYAEPAEFLRLSRGAAERVRRQSSTATLIAAELALFS